MKQIYLKSLMSRLSLISFVLLCSVFTSQNASSMSWKEAYSHADYNIKDESITFEIQTYFYDGDLIALYNYLKVLNLEYSEDGNVFNPLLTAKMYFQKNNDPVWMEISKSKTFAQISFPKSTLKKTGSAVSVGMKMEPLEYKNHRNQFKDGFYAVLTVKWIVPVNIKSIKSVRITGKWCEYAKEKTRTEIFCTPFDVGFVRPIKKAAKELNKNVKVTGKADIISVTGVSTGEIIKVYNSVSGDEVTSVIAQGDEVDIKLQKNQKYIIKVGQKSIKVAL